MRWLGHELEPPRAGARTRGRVALDNAGTATWLREGQRRICVSYHWLDRLGNPIVWDGLWSALPSDVPPGRTVEAEVVVRSPTPPGPYRLAFDVVAEDRYWFSEVGNAVLERDLEVAPRIARRLAVRGADAGALDRLEEPPVEEDAAEAVAFLEPGCVPAPDWSRRIIDAHAEGYAVVGGSIATQGGFMRRRPAALAPWAPGSGRVPTFAHPLLCPSIVLELEPGWVDPVEGLPALRPPTDEPWLYDGRITVTARPRSGRPRA